MIGVVPGMVHFVLGHEDDSLLQMMDLVQDMWFLQVSSFSRVWVIFSNLNLQVPSDDYEKVDENDEIQEENGDDDRD